MRLQHRGVGCKVSRGSRVWLNINAPQIGIQTKDRERSLLTQQLDLVDNLCTSVVSDKNKKRNIESSHVIVTHTLHIVIYHIVR